MASADFVDRSHTRERRSRLAVTEDVARTATPKRVTRIVECNAVVEGVKEQCYNPDINASETL